MARPKGELRYVPIRSIDVIGDNVRVSLGDIAELQASIAERGVLQPLLLSPKGRRFELVAGHRRLAGATGAGLTEVPALVKLLKDPRSRLEEMLTENLHRESLSPIEEANAYKRLRDMGLNQYGIAARCHVSQGHVSSRLLLLKLDKKRQWKVHRGELAIGTALQSVRDSGAYAQRALPTKPHKISKVAASHLPADFRKYLLDLEDVCDAHRYSFARAKALAERLTQGVSAKEAIAIVIRLVESKPQKARVSA